MVAIIKKNVIRTLCPKPKSIIATGGGSILHAPSVTHLKTLGVIIYLKLSHDILYQRLNTPPLPSFLSDDTSLQNYLGSRDAVYENVADHIVDISKCAIPDILKEIKTLGETYGS